jgi:hypothetical protein
VNAFDPCRDEQVVSRGTQWREQHEPRSKPRRVLAGDFAGALQVYPSSEPILPMMIDAKLCAHFADVCLRAVEQEDDPTYRAMLFELAAEWLIDAERELQASTRQRGKRGRAR